MTVATADAAEPEPWCYTTIRSDTDENIIPSSSTELSGAHNVMVRGLTHNDLLGNQRVFNMVKTAVLLD